MKAKLLILFFVVTTTQQVSAQLPGLHGNSFGGGNVDDLPVQFFIYPLLLFGAYLGMRKLKKQGGSYLGKEIFYNSLVSYMSSLIILQCKIWIE